MVKGISRQVILVQPPEPKLFEQAIFILRDGATGSEGVTDEALLKEAKALIRSGGAVTEKKHQWLGPAWACGGAGITGLIWLLSSYL